MKSSTYICKLSVKAAEYANYEQCDAENLNDLKTTQHFQTPCNNSDIAIRAKASRVNGRLAETGFHRSWPSDIQLLHSLPYWDVAQSEAKPWVNLTTILASRANRGIVFDDVDGRNVCRDSDYSKLVVVRDIGLENVLEEINIPRSGRGRPKCKPCRVGADKAYSCARIRRYLISRAIKSVIPRKSNTQDERQRFDRETYRNRNIVERAFGWIKEYRRIGTRYEKLGINFRRMLLLAMLKQCLIFMQSPDRT